MKYILTTYKKMRAKAAPSGFILPLTMLICTIVLIISSGITDMLAKGVYFSKLTKQSQLAYYAADDAMSCAIMIDDKYVNPDTGLGIFPNQDPTLFPPAADMQTTLTKVNIQRQMNNLSSLVLTDIRCATSDIFDTDSTGVTHFAVVPFTHKGEVGAQSSYSMRMDLGDGNFRCASVTVSKTANYRQIISHGYATCSITGVQQVERAIVNTTEAI